MLNFELVVQPMTEDELAHFCETAEVYAVNSEVWLVNSGRMIATHCSDITYTSKDWGAVYEPTFQKFIDFTGTTHNNLRGNDE